MRTPRAYWDATGAVPWITSACTARWTSRWDALQSYWVLGGYVCGRRELIEYLYTRARPFLFSTSHPPAVAASCLAAFDILEREPERIENLWNNTRYFKTALQAAGFRTGSSETPITPILVGDRRRRPRVFPRAVRGGPLRHRNRLPTVAQGQGARPHHHDRDALRDLIDRALES